MGLIVGGIVAFVSTVTTRGEPGHWWAVLAGGLLAALGIGFVAAFHPGAPKGTLIVNGAATLLPGLLVFFQWPVSALWYLAMVLGVQLILDGVTTAVFGRIRTLAPERADAPAT